jgi:hypothetical protein
MPAAATGPVRKCDWDRDREQEHRGEGDPKTHGASVHAGAIGTDRQRRQHHREPAGVAADLEDATGDGGVAWELPGNQREEQCP